MLESNPVLFWGIAFLAFVLLVTVACVGAAMLALWTWERSLSDTDEA